MRRPLLMARPVFGREEACKRVPDLGGFPYITEEDIIYVPDIFERGD